MKFSLPLVSPVSGLAVAGDLSDTIASCRFEEQPAYLGFSAGDHSVDRSVCIIVYLLFHFIGKEGVGDDIIMFGV